MAFPYLKDRHWLDLTRDERFFCAELYQQLKHADNLRSFLDLVNDKLRKPNAGESRSDRLPTDPGLWEVGFEVALYRDVVHSLGHRGNGHGPYTIGNSGFSRKRTFDLCLFSATQLIIIEAKVCEGLDSDQLGAFEQDRTKVRQLLTVDTPEVLLVGLWANSYQRKLDSRKGKNYTAIRNKVHEVFDGILHWNELTGRIPSPANSSGMDLWALAEASHDRRQGSLPQKNGANVHWVPSNP